MILQADHLDITMIDDNESDEKQEKSIIAKSDALDVFAWRKPVAVRFSIRISYFQTLSQKIYSSIQTNHPNTILHPKVLYHDHGILE